MQLSQKPQDPRFRIEIDQLSLSALRGREMGIQIRGKREDTLCDIQLQFLQVEKTFDIDFVNAEKRIHKQE